MEYTISPCGRSQNAVPVTNIADKEPQALIFQRISESILLFFVAAQDANFLHIRG